MSRIPFSVSLCIAVSLLFNCATTSKTTTHSYSKNKPLWVTDHPSFPDYFIGVGNAAIVNSDLGKAQQQSQLEALNDIARQIETTIASDVRLNENHIQINDTYIDSNTFKNQIQAMTQGVLKGWEIRQTWNDPSGFYWTQIALNKKHITVK
jgi:hypothetical protein